MLRRARHLYLCRRRAIASPRHTPEALDHNGLDLCVPHGCSMVARMPRYGPAPSGIRSAPRMRATGQNGRSRHVLALFDSSSERRIELSSGLLICGHIGPAAGGSRRQPTDFLPALRSRVRPVGRTLQMERPPILHGGFAPFSLALAARRRRSHSAAVSVFHPSGSDGHSANASIAASMGWCRPIQQPARPQARTRPARRAARAGRRRTEPAGRDVRHISQTSSPGARIMGQNWRRSAKRAVARTARSGRTLSAICT